MHGSSKSSVENDFFVYKSKLYSHYNIVVVIPAITPMILLGALVGVLAKVVFLGHLGDGFSDATEYTFLPFTALGVAISLFLGFHNNASYGRWWEARTIWGTHIIDLRNLLRFVVGTLGPLGSNRDGRPGDEVEQVPGNLALENEIEPQDDWRTKTVFLAMAHAHATRHQLRRGQPCPFDKGISALQDRNRFLTPTEQARVDATPNPANSILQIAAEIVGQQTHLDTYTRIHLMNLLDRLCVAQTACERIENTSLPLAYSLLVHRTAFLYVSLVPWAMVESMGWWT
eukprot:scaffold152_cov163-Amphora_coffeaeformis.AAC.14